MIIDLPDTSVTCADDDASNTDGQLLSTAPNADQHHHIDAGPTVPAHLVGGTPGGAPPLATLTAPPSELTPPERIAAPRQMMRDKHADMIARVDASIRGKAAKVIEGVMSAGELDDVDTKPEGWTDRRYRVARDARSCGKEAPVYIAIAEKVFASFKRAEATKPPASPVLNADVRVYVRNDHITVNYQTIDVTDE